MMNVEASLQDISVRERQLEAHILSSSSYLHKADQELKRQVAILYLAIAILILFQGLFTFRAVGNVPLSGTILVSITSILAIVNCLLLIKTKTWLKRLNEAWLLPQEKIALEALKLQRAEILTNQALARPGN